MFGCIVAGRPVQANLLTVSETQFVFTLAQPSSINHLVIFLLPDTILPPTHAATVHIRFPGQSNFQLLGGIGTPKPSAIFRVRNVAAVGAGESSGAVTPAGDTNMGSGSAIGMEGEAVLGISVEPVEVVEQQLAGLQGQLTVRRKGGPTGTLTLARRIIGDAFNYLGSFSRDFGGEEVVPLRAFRDWWGKFEKKVEYDPGFLEREGI